MLFRRSKRRPIILADSNLFPFQVQTTSFEILIREDIHVQADKLILSSASIPLPRANIFTSSTLFMVHSSISSSKCLAGWENLIINVLVSFWMRTRRHWSRSRGRRFSRKSVSVWATSSYVMTLLCDASNVHVSQKSAYFRNASIPTIDRVQFNNNSTFKVYKMKTSLYVAGWTHPYIIIIIIASIVCTSLLNSFLILAAVFGRDLFMQYLKYVRSRSSAVMQLSLWALPVRRL